MSDSARESGEGCDIISELDALIARRIDDQPPGSYTTELISQGLSHIRRKVGEEAVEVITAESDEELAQESADLLYHLLVYLRARGLSWDTLCRVLQQRRRGH